MCVKVIPFSVAVMTAIMCFGEEAYEKWTLEKQPFKWSLTTGESMNGISRTVASFTVGRAYSFVGSPELVVRAKTDETCTGRIDSLVRFVWDPIGARTITFLGAEHGTAGDLTVCRGRLVVGNGAAFRHVKEIRLGPGAALAVNADAGTNALASVDFISLGKGAMLHVPSTAFGGKLPTIVRDGDMTEVTDVGSRLQLLCDRSLVDNRSTSAVQLWHKPSFAGMVLRHDQPWEGDYCGYHSIVQDVDEKGPLFRIYYISAAAPPWVGGNKPGAKFRYTGLRVCYAESRDGINWEKPSLGIVSFAGSKDNNIILDSTENFWDNFMVMKDPNPDCLPSERYKGVGLYFSPNPVDKSPEVVASRGLRCYVSADGRHFTFKRLLLKRHWHGAAFDSLNVLLWDVTHKEYRLYVRGGHDAELVRFGNYQHHDMKRPQAVRGVKVSTSKDFVSWTPPEVVSIEHSAEEPELYTNNVEPYFRNPEFYIGFPTRYSERLAWYGNFDDLCGVEKRRGHFFTKGGNTENMRLGSAITDACFMYSHDGRRFTLSDEVFLSPGPEYKSNWIYGSCYMTRGFALTPTMRGDAPEMSFYSHVGRMSGEAQELDRYRLRIDGFASYHAGVAPKRLILRPLRFAGDTMFLNFATSGFGYIYVTVRDLDGNEIRSEQLFGDAVDRRVRFAPGALSKFANKAVTVRFDLSDADVYSFRFGKSGAKGTE